MQEQDEANSIDNRAGCAKNAGLAHDGSPMRRKLQAMLPEPLAKFMTGENLRARVARGSLWVGAGSGADQGLRLVRNMFLTRLLAPEAFGLMAIVLAVNTFFESFTEVGIDTAIVQSPRGEDYSYLNAAWWLSTGRAVGLYALIFISAPWVSQFYHQAALAPMMRVAFLATLFRGLMSPRTYVAHKKMDFKRLVAINQGGGVLGVLTTVILAFMIPGTWALVIGFTVEAAARLVLSYLICPFRPGLDLHKQSFQDIYRFSRGVFGLPILTFLFMRADVFVIGKLCSAADLGIYSMAAALGQIPFSLGGTLMGQIANPAFSEMQNDRARLNKTLLKVTSGLALFAFAPILYVALYGKDILEVVYGASYAQAAIPLSILFAIAMLRMLSVPVFSLYYMTGRPELNRRFAIVRTATMIVLIYPATKWYGLIGAASAGLIAMILGYALQVFRLRTITGLNVREYNRILWNALPLSLSVAIVWGLTHGIFKSAHTLQMAIGGIGCLLGYVLVLVLFPTRAPDALMRRET